MTITRIDSNQRMSQAVIHNGTIYLSGIVGVPGESVTAQTRTILETIDDLLLRSGSSKANLLSATIWLADMSDFSQMNVVWDAWVDKAAPPARATGESRLAAPDYKVEIIVTAAVA
jgi:enamine deaminase RidA (YjgF/YER057c/UK114 family)